MRIALIGDIHHYRLWVAPWRLLSKRLIGQSHLWFNRRFRFDRGLFEATLRRAAAIKPDAVLLSGDLTTTSLEEEFGDVAELLGRWVGGVPTVLAVPGNHDRYTGCSARDRTVERLLGRWLPGSFPHIRALGDRWSLLALDSAEPRFFSSRGRVGEKQLRSAQEQIQSLDGSRGLVILCHYPFAWPGDIRCRKGHRLEDLEGLRRLVAGCRCRVVYMHGHIHESWCWRPEGAGMGHVLDVNAGSPTMVTRRCPLGQGFWQIDLPNDPRGVIGLVRHRPNRLAGIGAGDEEQGAGRREDAEGVWSVEASSWPWEPNQQ